jgi:microcystin-dependent protein
MTALTYTIPAINEANSTADPKVATALTQILSTVNGGLDVSNLASSLQQLLVPSGTIITSAAAAAPTGYLACDGSAVSRSTYGALFSAIGTSFGAGDGSTTFNLPDTQGRVPVGRAPGGDSTVDTLGKNEGLAMASRHPRHNHTVPAHAHDMTHTHTFTTGVNSGGGFGAVSSGSAFAGNGHTHGGTTDGSSSSLTGTQSAFSTQDNNPSFLTVNYFVKT